MSEYRVYKVGEPEPVRVAGRVPRRGARPAKPLGPARARAAAVARRRGVVLWALVALAIGAGVFILWYVGREPLGNAQAAFGIAKETRKVPEWALVGAPVAAVVLVAAVTAYLAFGRHRALKLVGLAGVIVALAAPGVALGWANGQVRTLGGHDTQTTAAVREAAKETVRPLPGRAMNILLIGSDKSNIPGDPGRSDTQMLVRLDPATKTISMLSVPRDLRVYVDGVGYTKMNAAYSYGGDAGAIKAFKTLTGLPINHFIEIDFAGFWHVVNDLGGVYLPVDHRYFVPASADYKSINLDAGYQLVHGKQSLNFVRFRHDQYGDFGRMQRQQLFLRELQRQSGRWSGDWRKVLKLIKAITSLTTSDIDSLKKLEPLVSLIFAVNTSKVYSVHLEGATPMIDGVSYVTATQAEIDQVVHEFENPPQAALPTKGTKITKKMYNVEVYNGSGIAGQATNAANQLAALGYEATVGPDATEFPDKVTAVYAPKSLSSQAQTIAGLLWPSDVRLVAREPGGTDNAIKVFLASSFDGTLTTPQSQQKTTMTLQKNVRYDLASWQALDAKTPMHLEMPTVWSSGFVYDEFRRYSIETTTNKRTAAAVAVVRTPSGGYWDIQVMRWTSPPAVSDPTTTRVFGGTKYMLFYQGANLHMVAWKVHGSLYWVINTLDNELSSDVMLQIATSFKPVK